MAQKKILLSGIQPTGEIHIGNYLGSLRNFITLQNKYECYFMLATYHSITENYDSAKKKKQVLDLAADYLAVGLNPKKCIIFNQADVSAHTELGWIFNSFTPMSELERMTQFKDKSERQVKNINVGLFDYPVLQAADILLYHAQAVPIGKDQEQHLELTRKIVRWFNNKYKNYFTEPESIFTSAPRVMSLMEPEKKMSKSAGSKHYIAINDSPEAIEKKLKGAVTGTGTESTIPPGAHNLLMLFKEFNAEKEAKKFETAIKDKSIRYGEMKSVLSQIIADYFAEFRKSRKKLEKDEKYVKEVLAEGAKKANKVAQKTLEEVKDIIGVTL